MITHCRMHGYDYLALPYMSPLYLRSNTVWVWEKSFEPYLDLSQWPSYHGPDYALNLALQKLGKGKRKKKCLKRDMDAMKGYGDDMYGGGDFNETRGRNLCSVYKQPGHKASKHRRPGQQVCQY
jgi:hypothetical protein